MKYDHKKIEKKWQKKWEESQIFSAKEDFKKEKYYCLIEFPYPSGDGLHVGHPRPYIALDIIAHKRRGEGKNVLYPIGWDAFGLPTENYAIKTGVHPKEVTKKNTDRFREQIKSIGISFDWSREINTTDPTYYKWTQWIFLKFYEKGLAYKEEMPVTWCLACSIGLANEEVVEGRCERCGGLTEKRMKKQWMLAITKYADRLEKNLAHLDYLPEIKTQQINWIGRSEGAVIPFLIKDGVEKIEVFTTRADTLFGVTYLVLAPEHPLLHVLKESIKNWDEVKQYIDRSEKKTEIERTDAEKEKTGVELRGVCAIHPGTKKEIPIWLADYVLVTYGTGAIMAVPAHDERDFQFAKKFGLSTKVVIEPETGEKKEEEEFRRSIVAIVNDPATGDFLSINWGPEMGGNLFVGGGLEKGEDPIVCAVREVEEETGYRNLKLLSTTETIHHHYHAHSKGVDRYIEATGILFELAGKERGEVLLRADEKEKFFVEWVDRKKVEENVKDSLHALVFKRLVKGEIYSGEGALVDSGQYNGMRSQEAKKEITKKFGREKVHYKLRDWIFSRQRYWGEPIPIIFCEKCGTVPLPKQDLPLLLPDIENYKPTDGGESPLAAITDWVDVACPTCGGSAKRETDVMPNWAGSSWYFLRYADPKNDSELADKKKLKYWMPVDWYNGGMEHVTLHLLYSRFWNLFLYDIGVVPFEEPYKKRTAHGLILAESGEKMSKSKGNVINPDEIITTYGADTLRLYEMFMGPFDQAISWDSNGIVGVRRFLERVWAYALLHMENEKEKREVSPKGKRVLHESIQKISEDIETMRFNTAISQLMICLNALRGEEGISRDDFLTYLRLLAPFAPHTTEELWEMLGNNNSIHVAPWPISQKRYLTTDTATIIVQINGKVRTHIIVKKGMSEKEIQECVTKQDEVKKWLKEKVIKKIVYVQDKIINFVI